MILFNNRTMVKTTGILYLLGESSLAAESQGFGPFAENNLRAFHRAKISCEDMLILAL